MTDLAPLRAAIRRNHLADENAVLTELMTSSGLTPDFRARTSTRAADLVRAIRDAKDHGLMEVFLSEYGLSTGEGVALMCLAEALLRVPDTETIDALIEDKIAPSDWDRHLGHSSSSLVNASTWALMLTGRVLRDGHGMAATLRGAIKRLGEPVIRTAVAHAMKELGAQFVLGRTIAEAVSRGKADAAKGYTFSYDMLGEAAMTAHDADAFFKAYTDAITALTPMCKHSDIRENPGISIKLSALHPRYEEPQRARVLVELVERATQLALQARAAGMGLNIDAEEANRLDLSLDVIEAVLRHPDLAGWDGFGVVVQAYGKRAAQVLDWLYALATELDRKIMVRLVKGAYWDTEVKRAQVEGLAGFPVFTQKAATDVSYMSCAARLLRMTDRIYPQFATHNAHSVAAILEIADDPQAYEFQRLHGMGGSLHDMVLANEGTRCRIYAPVGAHRDLLAYLVRRLLENGANSSFVNQIVDETVQPETVAADPFEAIGAGNPAVTAPAALFLPERANSRGWDLHDPETIATLQAERADFATAQWKGGPILATTPAPSETLPVINPADPADIVGHVAQSSDADIDAALSAAAPWQAKAAERARILNAAADLYEANAPEFFDLMTREAGKTTLDTIAELREAVDFLRYYAARATELTNPARGVFSCISPWNFPLAIFTGQISAALAAGNAVLAKPAEATGLTATLGVRLLLAAGVPATALQLLPGAGSKVGARLTGDPRVNGVCFTGSTNTAQAINRNMAANLAPDAPLIAETGGLNAMIVDSTALPEQAIRDILASAFQSAGQRCSALRVLYLQEDIAKPFLKMLYGAMDELTLGNPWDFATDVGPVIDETAQRKITAHIAASQDRLLYQLPCPTGGYFVPPTVLSVNGIGDLAEEIFGPVLHVATYRAEDLDKVLSDINASGYGLTFGMHSRIDDRIAQAVAKLHVGNIYINRNQIGAIVGSQPFGGEGLSGTGPKAGGPAYVRRFTQTPEGPVAVAPAVPLTVKTAQAALDGTKHDGQPLNTISLPGPTGESNRLSRFGRGVVLCLGPGADTARQQAQIARENGCTPVMIAEGLQPAEGLSGTLPRAALATLTGFDAVALWASEADQRSARQALAERSGAILPLMTAPVIMAEQCRIERHVCIDTTAAGGNASLLAAAS